MAAESRKEQGQESAESMVDDLIRNILSEAGQTTQTAMRGPLAALVDVVASPSRSTTRISTIEKLLLAETIANAVANALAPALAETLAPEILKALEQHTAPRAPGGGEASARTGEGSRKQAAAQ